MINNHAWLALTLSHLYLPGRAAAEMAASAVAIAHKLNRDA
jgi:hypothetical protein